MRGRVYIKVEVKRSNKSECFRSHFQKNYDYCYIIALIFKETANLKVKEKQKTCKKDGNKKQFPPKKVPWKSWSGFLIFRKTFFWVVNIYLIIGACLRGWTIKEQDIFKIYRSAIGWVDFKTKLRTLDVKLHLA